MFIYRISLYRLQSSFLAMNTHDIYSKLYVPIISKDTVRCSLPDAFIAPRTVPTTEQQIPTKAIMTINQRIETV